MYPYPLQVWHSAWEQLNTAVNDRNHPFHLSYVATVDQAQWPQIRTMVLREADAHTLRLRFHTDVRSEKYGEVIRSPQVSCLFYDKDRKTQLRFGGTVRAHHDDALCHPIWNAMPDYSRQCYTNPPPGRKAKVKDAPLDARSSRANSNSEHPGRAHFAVLWLQVTFLDWLFLKSSGHQRIWYDLSDNEGLHYRWVNP